jgi:hypothetical protein
MKHASTKIVRMVTKSITLSSGAFPALFELANAPFGTTIVVPLHFGWNCPNDINAVRLIAQLVVDFPQAVVPLSLAEPVKQRRAALPDPIFGSLQSTALQSSRMAVEPDQCTAFPQLEVSRAGRLAGARGKS